MEHGPSAVACVCTRLARKRGPRFPDVQPTLSFHFCFFVEKKVQNQVTLRHAAKFALHLEYLTIFLCLLSVKITCLPASLWNAQISFFALLNINPVQNRRTAYQTTFYCASFAIFTLFSCSSVAQKSCLPGSKKVLDCWGRGRKSAVFSPSKCAPWSQWPVCVCRPVAGRVWL